MSFVWTEDISPGAPKMASNLNEIQTNLDTIYTALGITRNGCASGAGWTQFPIAGGLVTPKLSAQPQELRDVTDYAYENKCPAYNSGYQDGVDTTEDTGYNNGHLSGYDSTYKPGYYSDQHGTYNNGHLLGYDSTYKPGYDSGDDISYDNGDLAGVDSSHYPGALVSYRVPD
ncbi:hypothetical protein ES703_75749 [subsurface metagenome]